MLYHYKHIKGEIIMQTTTNINTINRIKKSVALNIRTLKAAKVVRKAKEENNASLIPYENLEPFNGMPVIKSEMALASMGVVAVVVIRDIFGDHTIYVDDFFDELSDNAKEFAMWHEVGHTKDPDIEVIGFAAQQWNRILQSWKGEIVREEVFADDYAVAQIGVERSVHALNELLALLHLISGCAHEVKLRLDRIQAGRRI